MNLMSRVIFISLTLFSLRGFTVNKGSLAQLPHEDGLFEARSGQKVSILELAGLIPPGSILVIGENHGISKHQSQQIQALQALRLHGRHVSVGMEFFSYLDQARVDQWRHGSLPEAQFLVEIGWGAPSFDFYRQQASFPDLSLGATSLALNAPRSLTGKIAKAGLASLNNDELALLPPQFSLGRDSYKQRFAAMMPHLPPGKLDQYFAAQSTWDDTMAWKAAEYMQNHPQQVLVIIVGEFHVQFGGGLIDRIRARMPGGLPVYSISQINREGLSEEELAEQLLPNPIDGVRADWIWVE